MLRHAHAATAMLMGAFCACHGRSAGREAKTVDPSPGGQVSPTPPPPCVPKDCADLPAGTCGLQEDGCGGYIRCDGVCRAGEGCLAGFLVPGTCHPCEPLFRTCGEIGKRCGGTLNGCGEELTCGPLSGPGCGATRDGRVAWVQSFGSTPHDEGSAAVLPDGIIIVAWYAAREAKLHLQRLTGAGSEPIAAWPVTNGDVRPVLTAGPGGQLFLRLDGGDSWTGFTTGAVDLGFGPRAAPYVAELANDGRAVRELCPMAGPCDGAVLGASARGDVLLASPGRTWVERADGSSIVVVSREVDGLVAQGACGAVALHPDGDVVCGGSTIGTFRDGFVTGRTWIPSVTKIGLDGVVRWTVAVDGISAFVSRLAIEPASGTIVAAGTFAGFGRFAGDTLWLRMVGPMDPGGFALGVGADGTPLFARQLAGQVSGALAVRGGRFAVVLGELAGSLVTYTSTPGGEPFVADWAFATWDDPTLSGSLGRFAYRGDELVVEVRTSEPLAGDPPGAGPFHLVGLVPAE